MQLGVIVGRFQVPELHEGHQKLISHILAQHGQVLILLGVTPVLGSKRNPLDFATRQKMIQEKFPNVVVAPLPDMPTDEAWSNSLDIMVRAINPLAEVVLYGGRDSFTPYYKGRFKTIEIELEPAPSGTDVRAVTANRVRVSSDFRAGVIYGVMNQYPRIFSTVDIAILRKEEPEKIKKGSPQYQILLGKKPNMDRWWLPGGFVSPEDFCLEDAARREALEETNIKCPTLEYVFSNRQSDWRYRNIEDGAVVTALFVCLDSIGAPVAKDDLDKAEFHPLIEDTLNLVGYTHKPLVQKILEEFGGESITVKGWKDR